MEEEYNWDLILKVSLPIAAVEAFMFYININNIWKWFALLIGLFASGAIVYTKNKKKNNIFTSVAIVFLVVLIVRFLRNLGFI